MANEVRLIDANALMSRFRIVAQSGGPVVYHVSDICAAIEDEAIEESVDAVEVVRCKDCKHFNPEKALRLGGIWCEYWGTDPDPEDFCSYGERRDV